MVLKPFILINAGYIKNPESPHAQPVHECARLPVPAHSLDMFSVFNAAHAGPKSLTNLHYVEHQGPLLSIYANEAGVLSY